MEVFVFAFLKASFLQVCKEFWKMALLIKQMAKKCLHKVQSTFSESFQITFIHNSDQKGQNKFVKKEMHILFFTTDILPQFAGVWILSVLDSAGGFWQIQLHPDNAKWTMFIRPSGIFFCKRSSLGIFSTFEFFQREMCTPTTSGGCFGIYNLENILD